MSEQRLIDQFDKNSIEKVKIHINQYNGNRYVDVRVWIKPDAGEDSGEIATKKELTLNVELIPGHISALEKARKASATEESLKNDRHEHC